MGEANGCGRGENAFGDHAVHSRDDFGKLLAASEFDADTAIAREASGASEDEVAEAGESGHSVGAASAANHQAGHFRQPAGDQGRNRIMSEAESIANPSRDGDDVLERTSEFHSDHVGVGIDTKTGVAELLLYGA